MSHWNNVLAADKDSVHTFYYDKEYGFPLHDNNTLFMTCLEICLEILAANLLQTEHETKSQSETIPSFPKFVLVKLLATAFIVCLY